MGLYQAHPVLMDYMPCTPATRARLEDLARSVCGTRDGVEQVISEYGLEHGAAMSR
jgi:hypothetical protein